MIEFLAARGYGARPCRKGKGSIMAGIAYIQGFELIVDPSCTHMQEELRRYSWPVDALSGDIVTGVNPLDAWNHCVDALRYGIESIRCW